MKNTQGLNLHRGERLSPSIGETLKMQMESFNMDPSHIIQLLARVGKRERCFTLYMLTSVDPNYGTEMTRW